MSSHDTRIKVTMCPHGLQRTHSQVPGLLSSFTFSWFSSGSFHFNHIRVFLPQIFSVVPINTWSAFPSDDCSFIQTYPQNSLSYLIYDGTLMKCLCLLPPFLVLHNINPILTENIFTSLSSASNQNQKHKLQEKTQLRPLVRCCISIST